MQNKIKGRQGNDYVIVRGVRPMIAGNYRGEKGVKIFLKNHYVICGRFLILLAKCVARVV